MNFENVAKEWEECRQTVGRFDNYLLRLRLLGFSVFTLIFTAITGAASDHLGETSFSSSAILFAIITLSLFVLSIYILDRYYERMLLIAVLRASRLESHRFDGFRIGLTTEIEFQKQQIHKGLPRKIIFKASQMVNFIYILIFLTLVTQYIIVLLREASKLPYIGVLAAMTLIVFIVARNGNALLKEPYALIKDRSNIVTSPMIMSKDEIHHSVGRIAYEVCQWMTSTRISRLHIVTILPGARSFTEDLLKNMKELQPKAEFFTHLVQLGRYSRTASGSQQNEIICGCLPLARLKDAHVLIIGDILKTGSTLLNFKTEILKTKAKSVKTAALIKKYSDTELSPDFLGFDLALDKKKLKECGILDCWLFGYGTDYNDHYREIEHIGWVEIKES